MDFRIPDITKYVVLEKMFKGQAVAVVSSIFNIDVSPIFSVGPARYVTYYGTP